MTNLDHFGRPKEFTIRRKMFKVRRNDIRVTILVLGVK